MPITDTSFRRRRPFCSCLLASFANSSEAEEFSLEDERQNRFLGTDGLAIVVLEGAETEFDEVRRVMSTGVFAKAIKLLVVAKVFIGFPQKSVREKHYFLKLGARSIIESCGV